MTKKTKLDALQHQFWVWLQLVQLLRWNGRLPISKATYPFDLQIGASEKVSPDQGIDDILRLQILGHDDGAGILQLLYVVLFCDREK